MAPCWIETGTIVNAQQAENKDGENEEEVQGFSWHASSIVCLRLITISFTIKSYCVDFH